MWAIDAQTKCRRPLVTVKALRAAPDEATFREGTKLNDLLNFASKIIWDRGKQSGQNFQNIFLRNNGKAKLFFLLCNWLKFKPEFYFTENKIVKLDWEDEYEPLSVLASTILLVLINILSTWKIRHVDRLFVAKKDDIDRDLGASLEKYYGRIVRYCLQSR